MWNRLREGTTTNIGLIDRIIRSAFAVIIFALVVAQVITGWVVVVPLLLSIYLIVTGNIGYSPVYHLFKYSTNK
jgi:hypothetical protein